MQLLDRIEKRRFVGREFLVWLWFETELFEGTLTTREHGEFGMWIEGTFALSSGRETTRIRGSQPASRREAKESMLRGKWPESAGLHLHWQGQDASFSLKAETLGVSSLKPPTVLDDEAEEEALGPPQRRSKKKADADPHDGQVLALADRMQSAATFEALLEALYRDFLALRLGAAWPELVLPAINGWLRGEAVDEARYGKARERALGKRRKA